MGRKGKKKKTKPPVFAVPQGFWLADGDGGAAAIAAIKTHGSIPHDAAGWSGLLPLDSLVWKAYVGRPDVNQPGGKVLSAGVWALRRAAQQHNYWAAADEELRRMLDAKVEAKESRIVPRAGRTSSQVRPSVPRDAGRRERRAPAPRADMIAYSPSGSGTTFGQDWAASASRVRWPIIRKANRLGCAKRRAQEALDRAAAGTRPRGRGKRPHEAAARPEGQSPKPRRKVGCMRSPEIKRRH